MSTTDKPENITFKLQTFTDEEIDSLLEGDNFRLLSPGHRERILTEMRADRWSTGNGECLSFSAKGALLNGQHRLAAAQIYQRETETKVWFWCAHNVDEKARFSMDQAKVRSLTDHLRHEGVEYANEHRPIIRGEALIQLAKTKTLCSLVNGVVSKDNGRTGKPCFHLAPSLGAQVDVFRRNRGAMLEWARINVRMRDIGLPRAGILAAIGFQLAKVDRKNAIAFFDKLVTGTDMGVRDPIRVLRERLLKERTAKAKVTRVVIAGLLVKAWCLWNKGQTVDYLRYNASGPSAEEFPDHRDVA